ncbi:MAG: hypothetical protein J6W04_02060 [Bacteroidales bacterium]|nr:hypothetical protein [Bacteroidales bacterium]
MKTLNEVINALEICSQMDAECDKCPYKATAKGWCEEKDRDALQYLKAYRDDKDDLTALRAYWKEQHENQPLTWDELKQMLGKPVYLEQYWYPTEDETGATEDETETDKYWAVIDDVQAKRVHVVGKRLSMGLCKDDLNRQKHGGWQAYRKEN